MLTKHTIANWKRRFKEEMRLQLGNPYWYGGGQMIEFTGRDGIKYSGIDPNGYPTGKDCSGGIIFALEEATGLEFALCPPRGFLNKPWLKKIEESELLEGDLILVDIPRMKGSSPLHNEKGDIEYGVFDHVMTYFPHESGNDIITTEGSGGDQRKNPHSEANTRRWKLKEFKKVSNYIFKGATQYEFRRILWQYFYDFKSTHQV